jgi:PLP dependent protein
VNRLPLATAPGPETVAARLEEVRRRIAATGRPPESVRVVAVTKGFRVEAVRAALAAGVGDIGENYATELLSKAKDLAGRAEGGTDADTAARWHFLGAVQRRRVRDLAGVVDCWQTLARAVEGEAIAQRAPGACVLVELDSTGDPARNGCAPAEVPTLVEALRHLGLDVRGLMTVAPRGGPELSRRTFRLAAEVASDLGLGELSMGMTHDLEVAVEEGATMVRVGQALYGARPGA